MVSEWSRKELLQPCRLCAGLTPASGSRSRLCGHPAGKPWTSDLASLHLGFLDCSLEGMINRLCHGVAVTCKSGGTEALRIVPDTRPTNAGRVGQGDRHPRFIALRRYFFFFFNKLKVCGDRASSKSVGILFPARVPLFVSLSHVSVILQLFQTFFFFTF